MTDFLSEALKLDPQTKWSMEILSESRNKAYFPSKETLLKYGVKGITDYPYPKSQHELDKLVKDISDDFTAIGDFSVNDATDKTQKN